ncbi:related to ALG12 - alpha-1,6-mannosyltransferase [Ustilago trichophora]|uniref:Mannosyltransferase n=1 Tax=Ustilago trichophora TaxID=86804 RepID=A0A5C3DRI5_9BASI|nr:related to ALG12 - alpha-1,6-mannosyltransferase [Ustilago trichophora]
MERLSSLVWLCGLPCLLVLVSWRTLSCPYTKVEESFTIQAVHDILSFGVSPDALARYDHQVFPGAVPRSFIGPILLSAISYVFILLSRSFGAVKTSADIQIIVRLCLATTNVTAIAFFCQQCFATTAKAGKRSTFGTHTQAGLFLLITAVQFHFAFWVSRTIPNSLSLPFVVVALALVCRNIGTDIKRPTRASHDAKAAIWLLTFSAVVLRLEIVATLIPVGLYLLITGRISFWAGLKAGILSGSTSVLLTTMTDTYFWQDLSQAPARNMLSIFLVSLRNIVVSNKPMPLWPELHALLFNVVEGKSGEWGVSPWHAYATSLVPKLLAFTCPLVLLGVLQLLRFQRSAVEARARFLLLTAITHIAMLSLLGHKEWRFAFYVLPALNVVAATGGGVLIRSWPGKAILATLVLLQIGLSWFTGHLSAINYPGGEALRLLHEQLASGSDGQVIVHIDVLPAMTGVTLFQSLNLERNRSYGRLDRFAEVLPTTCEKDQCWIYDKTEDLLTNGPEAAQAWSSFTHLITEAPGCNVLRSKSPSSSEKGAVLAETDQPFEPIAPPISAFSGLKRKTISQIKNDLISLPRALFTIYPLVSSAEKESFAHLMRLALPVIIKEDPAVWMCRRKDKFTR